MVVDGYVRVSQVAGRAGERFIGPAVQREQIEGWAREHGAAVAHVFEELDESGGRKDRPLLEAAIQRVERGETNGLVVAYTSRFGRSLLDGLTAIQRIMDAGGTFASVQGNLDFSTDIGRHMLRTMLSWAEWELDRTRSNWQIASERAIARGVFLGPAPFGYRGTPSGRLDPDPEVAPVVAELFRLRAAGMRHTDLRDLLMERGIRSPHGNTYWSRDSVRRMLRNRAYLGESRHGELVNTQAHPPLVNSATWELAQSPIQRRPLRSGLPESVLAGLLRCAGCQRLLHTGLSGWGTSEADLTYRCNRSDYRSPCPAPAAVRASVVEPFVEALFWRELSKDRRAAPRRLVRLRETVVRRDRELSSYRDNARLPTTLGSERFAEGLAVRVRRLELAEVELQQAKRAEGPPPIPAEELRARWHTLTNHDRRRTIGEAIDAAFVRRGRGPLDQRLFVCGRGKAPAGLPGFSAVVAARPFDPTACHPPVRSRPIEAWSRAHLENTLTDFVTGRERWPSFLDFQAAGHALLYDQVQQHGGPRHWAHALGLSYVPRLDGEMTDGRIREELVGYLADKADWPSVEQFRADGRRWLREAVRATGGPARWAAEFGIDLPSTRQTQRQWTYARMRHELAVFAAGRDDWPVRAEFRDAGLLALYEAINRAKVRDRLATDLALTVPAGRQRIRKHWTDARIYAALEPFLAGRETWPTQTEFREAGLNRLYRAITDSGQRDTWAIRAGLTKCPRVRALR